MVGLRRRQKWQHILALYVEVDMRRSETDSDIETLPQTIFSKLTCASVGVEKNSLFSIETLVT